MKKRLIIWTTEDGTIAVDILKDGYNIIERTIYDADEVVKPLLNRIKEEGIL